MRANWFVAFPVEGTFLLELPEPPRSFRRFHPDDVHLTLAFLGGCSELAAERAWQALEIGLTALAPRALDVSLGAVAAMGPQQRYSALSALLEGGRLQTAACISALRDPVSQAAMARRDERPPKPHITLARPRRQANDQDREQGLEWARTLDLTGIARRLDRIALYTWTEDRRDRLFRIVTERALPT